MISDRLSAYAAAGFYTLVPDIYEKSVLSAFLLNILKV